jgi:hypothetical protein
VSQFTYQQAFAQKLKAAGHEVMLVEAKANAAQHHGLTHMTNRTLGWCNAGFDSERIAKLILANVLAPHAPKP